MENDFTLKFTERTKKFAVHVIQFCKTFEKTDEAFIIKKQLIRSVTSVAANFRASVRGRSKAEWYSKICIVVEEADEVKFWIELIEEAKIKCDEKILAKIKSESEEILKIVSKTRKTAKDNM